MMNIQSLFTLAAMAIVPAAAFASENVNPTLSPAPMESVDCLPEIQLTFPGVEDENVVLDEDMAITITDGATTHKCTVYGWGAHRFIVFGDGMDITDGGTWTLSLPEGAFSVDGHKSARVEAAYIVAP